MFNTCEFTFAGVSSAMYDLYVCNIGSKSNADSGFGNEASIFETRLNDRVNPLHYGVNYHTKPLQFNLVFGYDQPMDRYRLQEVSMWLTGHQQYQWLSIEQEDMENVQFRCLITKLAPITVGWVPYAFEATIQCDCPYAYSYPFEQRFTVSGETDIILRNKSSAREPVYPIMDILEASGGLTIVNHSDGDETFTLDATSGSSSVTVDHDRGIITDNVYGTNLYDQCNMRFLRMVQGDNYLTVTGDATLVFRGRYFYNVGA